MPFAFDTLATGCVVKAEAGREERQMITRLVLTCALMMLSEPAAAAQLASPVPEIGEEGGQVDHYPPHKATFPNGVTGIPGVVYRVQTGYRPLTLDLYLPPPTLPRTAQGFPLIVFIHGGGWMRGDSHRSGAFVDFPGVLASLSARGYVVASIEYRLSSEAVFPAQAQDVKAAIRWLRSHGSEYGIDPERAMTWGPSAGGHLASLVAVSCHAQALEPVPIVNTAAPDSRADANGSSNASDCVQGSVSWFGVFDFASIAAQAKQDKASSRDVPDTAEWRLLGCFANKCENGQMAAASPVTYVNAKNPPMLLIVGSDDKIVPYHQTLEMAEKLKASGVSCELIVIPGVDHSLIGKTPEETRQANLKALDATFRFIDKTMSIVR